MSHESILAGKARHDGFSLMELLIVVSIMATLAIVSAPMLSSIGKAGAMNKAVLNLSLFLQQARAYAMANNTYVWVGFKDDPTQKQLMVTAVMGTTGASTDLGSALTYSPISKVQLFRMVNLSQVSGLTGQNVAVDVTGSSFGNFQQITAGSTQTFSNVLQFSPSGQVTIAGNDISHWIQIGLHSSVENSANAKNVAALQVGGLTGQVQIFRP